MIVSDKKDKNLYIIIFTTNKVGIKLCCRAKKKAEVKIAAYIRTLQLNKKTLNYESLNLGQEGFEPALIENPLKKNCAIAQFFRIYQQKAPSETSERGRHPKDVGDKNSVVK